MKILCAVLIMLALAACTPETPELRETEDAVIIIPVPEPRVYIALGDSVPAGFGVSPQERYTALFYGMLKSGGYIDKYVNMGADGFTAADKLAFLRAAGEPELALFKNARVITLNIGGNNILVPFLNYLPDPEQIAGMVMEARDFALESRDTVAEAVDLAHEVQEALENWSFWQVWRLPELNRIMRRVSETLGDLTGILADTAELELVGLAPVMLGSFSPELEAELERGAGQFAGELEQIMAWLREHAPDALIIVNTVYNPVPRQFLGIELEISDRAGGLVRELNAVISGAGACAVADIYALFTAAGGVTNFYLDMAAMSLSFDLIHPNAAGHGLIAHANYQAFRKLNINLSEQ